MIALSVGVAACVDAPITADQLQADGSLRGAGGGGQQAAFSADAVGTTVQAVQVSAVLAAQADGPLEDRAEFAATVGTVYLHVRADGLLSPRNVTYRWRHGDFSALVPGTLEASDSMALGAHFDIDPTQAGHWEVDVLASPEPSSGADGEPAGSAAAEPRVLFHREFVVQDQRL